jgi:hypothetical protein
LTVGPAAKTVTAGAAATTLMATLTGSTSAIAWPLSGDGALSATSGTTTTVDGWTEEMGGATVTALLVPNSSATGYTTFPSRPQPTAASPSSTFQGASTSFKSTSQSRT